MGKVIDSKKLFDDSRELAKYERGLVDMIERKLAEQKALEAVNENLFKTERRLEELEELGPPPVTCRTGFYQAESGGWFVSKDYQCQCGHLMSKVQNKIGCFACDKEFDLEEMK